jgi:hypothetical protein
VCTVARNLGQPVRNALAAITQHCGVGAHTAPGGVYFFVTKLCGAHGVILEKVGPRIPKWSHVTPLSALMYKF